MCRLASNLKHTFGFDSKCPSGPSCLIVIATRLWAFFQATTFFKPSKLAMEVKLIFFDFLCEETLARLFLLKAILMRFGETRICLSGLDPESTNTLEVF